MPVNILQLKDALCDEAIRGSIKILSEKSSSLFSMYGSIDFLESEKNIDDNLYVIIHRENDNITNILVVKLKKHFVELVPAKITSVKTAYQSLDVVTCDIFGLVDKGYYNKLILEVFSHFREVDCIAFKSIDNDSDQYKSIIRLSECSKYFFVMDEYGPRDFYTMELMDSLDEYLHKFSKKERYNLKRQCRLASEATGQSLKLVRIASYDQIESFIEKSKQVLNNSWKSEEEEKEFVFSEVRCQEYAEFSKNGLLRSYLLLGNDEPWAYVIGYQWNGVYHYANIAYDSRFSDLSPGTVLFYLMLEDLYSFDKPYVFNFGIWGSFYKKRFSNHVTVDRSLLILRNNLYNKFIATVVHGTNSLKKKLMKSKSLAIMADS